MAVFKRTLTRIQDGGFAKAKKLADLALKTNVDSKGRTTTRGYEQALSFIEPFVFSQRESESLDAQRLVASYNNSFTKLSTVKNKTNRTVGQFEIDEREIFFVTPTSGNRTDIMRDIPSMVSQISDELSLHVFGVENAIEEAVAEGESADSLQNYLFEVQKRQRLMSELNNDLLNDEISDKAVLNGYGVYVDADQNDGELLGVAVAPIGDLPKGIDSGGFSRVDSSAAFGNGYIPVFSKFTDDGLGLKTSRIGNKVWSGIGSFALQYDKKSDQQFKNDPGNFNLTDVPDKGVGLRPGSFSRGYTGFDVQGNPKQTTFYAGEDGKIYSLDDDALESFKRDPVLSERLKRTTNIDSSFAKNLMRSEDIESFTPDVITAPQTGSQAVQPVESESQGDGFFSKLGGGIRNIFGKPNRSITSGEAAPVRPELSFFGNRVNRQSQPGRVPTGGSPEAIIDSGNQFFRNTQ